MKAEELRIGNWLLGANGEYFQVYAYGIMDIHCEPIATKNVQPIYLNDKTLNSCGFESAWMDDLGMSYGLIVSDELTLSINNWTVWIDEYDTKIDTVHQLMNLYYALTGTELTIDL